MSRAPVIMRCLSAAVLLAAGCADPPELTPKPCYAKHVAIEIDDDTALDLQPRDATGEYARTFVDDSGRRHTIEVVLFKPVAAWERVVVREPTFGFEETPACDPRIGVELEVELYADDDWFSERFHAAAVRTTFQDAWLVRMVRPIDAIDGGYPEKRPADACPDVDIGFDLSLEDGDAAGAITESQPQVDRADDPCYREVLRWDRP